jgi:hypothetical protein
LMPYGITHERCPCEDDSPYLELYSLGHRSPPEITIGYGA